MRKIYIPVIFLFFFANSAIGQMHTVERKENQSQKRFADNLFFGGIVGLQFGSQTRIEIAPIIGYKITERLSAGLGLKYIYYKIKDNYSTLNYSTNIYGGGPFARFTLFEGLFLHGEYEILNLEVPDLNYNLKRENITSVFLGGGYRQMIGDRSSIDLLILYNVNDNRNSPYNNPVIRIGFGFGI